MKTKKDKDLALKLIDDLLDEDSESALSVEETATSAQEEDLSLQGEGEDPSALSSPPPLAEEKTEVVVPQKSSSNHVTDDDIKASVGRFAAMKSSGFANPSEVALAQSENLRIAQQRILDLETEVERLRGDNEQLAAAGETLRKKADELLSKLESAQKKLTDFQETSEQEVELLRESVNSKEKQIEVLRIKNDELEMRVSTNIQKIRVRERELENRLELIKMEGAALVRNKDEIILDLKRQVDQLNLELDNYRNKGQELNRQLSDKQDMLRRTVKALRIALSMLEGDEDIHHPLKKVK